MAGINKAFRFREKQLEYDIRIRRKFPWWVLLLLLPLLLLIRCQRDLTVNCIESETETPLSYQEVSLSYVDHFIEKSGCWFSSDSISVIQQTDSSGVAVFKNLPCSVYSYLIHALQEGRLNMQSECYESVDYKYLFHFTRQVLLKVDTRREDLRIRVVDAETGDPLPDALVDLVSFDYGQFIRDSVKVDAAGVATLSGMRYCSSIDTLIGRCFGYYPEKRTNVLCRNLLIEDRSTDLRLQPVKERFTFFVKNVVSKEPIPDAICKVTLSLPGNSQKKISREVRTSIDGKGIAIYTDAPIISTVFIHASKINYKDSVLANGPRGPWRVVDFVKQSDDVRTIWLEPLPYSREFVNVDSLTMCPIPGVLNEITITHPDGGVSHVKEFSNTSGVFQVSATDEDKIEIISSKGGEFIVKRSLFPKVKDIVDRKILMQPDFYELEFQTVYAGDPSSLLPDCSLIITGSVSGSLPPNNSGNGVFFVKMRKMENLSITSSKNGFKTNSTTIFNQPASFLYADSSRRVIPMEWDLPPCNGGIQSSYTGPSTTINSYSMGQMSGTASIWVDFFSWGDYLTVYDGPSATGVPIINRTFIENVREIPFSFTKGAVTVVVESGDNSSGRFIVRCPVL